MTRLRRAFCVLAFQFVFSSLAFAAGENNITTDNNAANGGTHNSPLIALDQSTQSDPQIQTRLRTIYNELESLRSIQINVSNGIVTITGEIDSVDDELKALQFAQQVEGVVEVENQLTLNRNVGDRIHSTSAKLIELGRTFLQNLPLFILTIIIVVLFWLLGSWLSKKSNLFRQLSPNYFIATLLGQIVHLALIILGFVLALVLLDATALLGTILGAAGIFGLAIGFAVRDTVENYIASILLSIRNPFEVNDLVEIEGQLGKVARLTSRATIMISPDGNHIRIPNATVFKAIMINYTRNPERRFEFDVGVDTEQDLLSAQSLALITLGHIEGVMSDPKPVVLIEQLGDSNVSLRIYAWVDQQNYDFGMIRSEAIRLIKEAFDSAGIVMPEPIYQLRMMEGIQNNAEQNNKEEPAKSSTVKKPIQDVRADRSIEEKIENEQHQSGEENLLHETASKE